jgi:SAM-dependent methyltransferase
MRILVAIANYGFKNKRFIEQLIASYSSMPAHIDIVVLSDVPKNFSKKVEIVVGLPAKNPWSLPYAHKAIFSNRREAYDLFIYSEDDILITWNNIKAFLDATAILAKDECAGFLRYELDENGNRSFPDFVGPYHWMVGSIKRIQKQIFARFSNLHSACYILTRDQLKAAIESGGYLVKPHEGKYDLLCSAATDPYSKCGMTKLICISKLSDFLVHHLSNRYSKECGISENDLKRQIKAISDENQNLYQNELVETIKRINTYIYDKMYYDEIDKNLLSFITEKDRNILSIGCGSGATEELLVKRRQTVTAIPVDRIIAELAKSKNIEVLTPDFHRSFDMIKGQAFDCIILDDILHHLEDPIGVLRKAIRFLKENGKIVITLPNFFSIRNVRHSFPYPIFKRFRYKENRMTVLSLRKIRKELKRRGLVRVEMKFPIEEMKKVKVPDLWGLKKIMLCDKIYMAGSKSCAEFAEN